MNIILLGKNGLLGRELRHVFSKKSHDKLISFNHADLDITDIKALTNTLREIKPSIVINAAAFTYVDECEAKKNFVMKVNGEANGPLAAICKSIGAHLVYFSTDYVFDGTKNKPYVESDTPCPINTYGTSKLLGEQQVQGNTDKYSIIRTSWLFGMHGHNFVTTMLNLAEKGKSIEVVDDQIGKPTYSYDLANSVIEMLSEETIPTGIFHLVNEHAVSWYHFAKEIFDGANLPNVHLKRIQSTTLDRAAKRPHNCALENTKRPLLRTHQAALNDYLHHLTIK